MFRLIAACLFFAVSSPNLIAAPVLWRTVDGGNGHHYELVFNSANSVTWSEAKGLAEASSLLGVQGHLATTTSLPEVEFLRNNLPLPAVKIEFWLGGFQDLDAPDYSEPAGGWRWVTGEPWNFTYWWFDEPNNNGGNPEHFLQTAGASGTQLRWNDGTQVGSIGYIVEFATIPEPSTFALAAFSLLSAGLRGCRLINRNLTHRQPILTSPKS